MCHLLSACRRSVLICVYRVVWRLDASLGLIGIEVGLVVGVATLNVGSICRVLGHPKAHLYIYQMFCRRHESRRRHARRRFVSVVYCGIPMLICAKDGILCRGRNANHLGSRRGFVCVRVCSCHVCLPEGHVSLNIIEKIIPSPRLKPRTVFGVVALSL
jgi:hypothetical protein